MGSLPPVGPLKKLFPGLENPGRIGGRGGATGRLGAPGRGGTLGRGWGGMGGLCGRWGGAGGRGAVSVPSVVWTRGVVCGGGELSAKLHCVLQMLSRRTASTPTSAIS